jgi:hypothetical protein
MSARGENPWTPKPIELVAFADYGGAVHMRSVAPMGFLFIGRRQSTASLPVAQLESYVSPPTCRCLSVDSIGHDAVLVRWCGG